MSDVRSQAMFFGFTWRTPPPSHPGHTMDAPLSTANDDGSAEDAEVGMTIDNEGNDEEEEMGQEKGSDISASARALGTNEAASGTLQFNERPTVWKLPTTMELSYLGPEVTEGRPAACAS